MARNAEKWYSGTATGGLPMNERFAFDRFASRGLLALSLLWSAGMAGAAELRFMVEPSYDPSRATEVYKPLVDYLSQASGQQIVLITPRNYHFFWRDIRQNVPVDLLFAEAHITDYRATRYKTVPIVRAAEKTSYTLFASDQLKDPTLQGLVGHSIVTMPSPSLGFSLLIEFYPNPVAQPNILSSAASWSDGLEIVFSGEADAAIVPTTLRNLYPQAVPIRTSREFPGAAISVAPTMDPAVRDSLKAALLRLHENAELFGVLNELGITRFEETSAAEYVGSELMLKGVYGYE
jgi:hypothetical protein